MTNLQIDTNQSIILQDSRKLNSDQEVEEKNNFSYIHPSGIFSLLVFAVLPFIFGGRGDFAGHAIKIFLYLSVIITSATVFYKKAKRSKDSERQSGTLSDKQKIRTFSLFLPLLTYLLLQLVPMPINVLGSLSETAMIAYQKTGSAYGYLSLNPENSLNAISWIFLFICLYVLSLSIAYKTKTIEHGNRRSKSRQKTIHFSKVSRDYDHYSDLVQKVVITISLLCAFIGITHLMLQASALFGVFSFSNDYQFTFRAHWPFVNANQLAVMLEIGMMLTFTRFLRERQLRVLSITSEKDHTILKKIEQTFYSLEKQASSLIVMFVLGICLIFTMSRAGIFLTFFGMTFLWVVYKLNPPTMIASAEDARRKKLNPSKGIAGKIYNLLKLTLVPLIIFVFFLSYLGGDVSSKLTSRIDQAVEQGGDASRSSLNIISWNVLKLNPVFGVGLNSWQNAANQFSVDETIGWHLDYAHNDYLQFISEVGILGFLCVLLPLAFGIKKVLKLREKNLGVVRSVYFTGILCSFMVPALHAVVDFPYHLPILSMGIFFAFLCFSRELVFFELKSISLED